MPLNHGTSKEAFSSNVKELMNSGHSQKQALAIAYSIQGEKKSISAHDWRHAEILAKDIESSMSSGDATDYVDFDLGNGILTVGKDAAGYISWLSVGDKIIHEGFGENAGDIVTSLFSDGFIQPKCSACNDEHVEYLDSQMEKMQMKKTMSNDEFEQDSEVSDKSPLNDSIHDEDHDGNDEEIIDSESNDDFAQMSPSAQQLVIELLNKHNSQQPPQINEYPEGGNEVGIFGDDGLYYYYIITPDDEVVYLATMGKSMKKLGPTMQDLVQKSNPVFKNDFNFFGKSDPDSLVKSFMQNGNEEILWPRCTDYETGYGNSVTKEVKDAIFAKQKELGASGLYAIVNNNDGTYKAIFEIYNEKDFYADPKKIGFNIDRNGVMTPTTNEATMVKAFSDFKFTKTNAELQAQNSRTLKITEKEDVIKSSPVSKQFLENQEIPSLLEDYKKETLTAQNNSIRNNPNRKVNW